MQHIRNLSELLKTKFSFEEQANSYFLFKLIALETESRQNLQESTDDSTYNQKCQFRTEETFNDLYLLGPTIGQGAQAVVKKCWKKKDHDALTYAVKITRTEDEEIMTTIKNTYLIGRMLQHQGLLQLHELFIENGVSYLVMEYSQYPTLEQLLKKKKCLNERVVKIIVKNLLLAVQFMHQKGICHRDIKPDNILVNPKKFTTQLTDLGVSGKFKIQEPGQSSSSQVFLRTVTGNILYRAPEIHSGSGYNQAVDIWAIGILTFQSLTNQLPFTQDDILYGIEKNQIQNVLHMNGLSPLSEDFISRLLEIIPEKRLDAKDCLMHPWLYIDISKSDSTIGEVHSSQDDIYISTRSMQLIISPEQSPAYGRTEIKDIRIKKNDKLFSPIQFIGQINSGINIETTQASCKFLNDLDIDEVCSQVDNEIDINEEVNDVQQQQLELRKYQVKKEINLNSSF